MQTAAGLIKPADTAAADNRLVRQAAISIAQPADIWRRNTAALLLHSLYIFHESAAPASARDRLETEINHSPRSAWLTTLRKQPAPSRAGERGGGTAARACAATLQLPSHARVSDSGRHIQLDLSPFSTRPPGRQPRLEGLLCRTHRCQSWFRS